MADELRALVGASGAPDDFATFLIDQDLTSIADFACAVTSEGNVDIEIIPEYEKTLGDGVRAVFKVKTKIRQAWLAARKSINTAGPSSSSGGMLAITDEFTLPEGTESRLIGSWTKRHDYNLPGTMLVNLKCLAKMYKGYTSARRTLYVPMMSEIKLKSALPTAEISGSVISGSSVYEVSAPARADVSLPEFFLLVRAWFTSWAFIAANDGDWFDYGTCLHFVEMLYTYVFMRHDSRQPSLTGLTKAFLCTLTDFATEVQNNSVSLGSLVKKQGLLEPLLERHRVRVCWSGRGLFERRRRVVFDAITDRHPAERVCR